MKVVVNRAFGGFGLSKKAISLYNKKAKTNFKSVWEIENSFGSGDDKKFKFRSSEILIAVVEKLGDQSHESAFDRLEIVEIPNDAVNPYIDEYDGAETIREGRTW